jgi:hypothetical protein
MKCHDSWSAIESDRSNSKKMCATRRNRMLGKAFSTSLVVNALMALLGMAASAFAPMSVLGKVSDLIAAPTGYLIGTLIQPKVHSAGAFVAAALEGLIFSVVFYAALAWGVLKLIAILRSRRTGGAR